MINNEILSIQDLIRNKADYGKLVMFIGSGVSRNVDGMPSWWELVNKMANSITFTKCASCIHNSSCTHDCPASEDYSTDDYLKIPQYAYNHNKDNYNDILKKSMSATPNIDAPLSKAIFELKPDHIITTNYDKLLESSQSDYRSLYDVIIHDKDLLTAQKNKYIIKMHGDISDISSIVLKENDYLEYSQKHVLIELFIKSLIVDHIILFLGYSLNDNNVKLIISWINYLRTQNNSAIGKNKYIGYIILDEPTIAEHTLLYFHQNNIQVINIHTYPISTNVPKELKNDKGKKLYSFLSAISNPAESKKIYPIEYMERTIDFLLEHTNYDYAYILSKLQITQYMLINSTLLLYNAKEYQELLSFFQSSSKKIYGLHQILADAGIHTIIDYSNSISPHEIEIKRNNRLLRDPLYCEYIQNNYIKLLELCELETNNEKKSFYLQFIKGISTKIDPTLNDPYSDNIRQNLVQICNNTIVEAQSSFYYNPSTLEHYIDNIASSDLKQAYQPFKYVCKGNASEDGRMHNSLDRLQTHTHDSHTFYLGPGGSLNELYKIKNRAIAYYYFYYFNHLLTCGINHFSSYLQRYIEGMICANGNHVDVNFNIAGLQSDNQKYSLTPLDIDILTKYTSIKDLHSFIKENNVSLFNLSRKVINHLICCTSNMIDSLTSIEDDTFKAINIPVLCNLALLITYSNIPPSKKPLLSAKIHDLFKNNSFIDFFWNYNKYTKLQFYSIGKLCELIPPVSDISIIKSIVSSSHFYESVSNVNINNVKKILYFCLPKENSRKIEKELVSIIDNTNDPTYKIQLLRIFYERIQSPKYKKHFSTFLSGYFSKLGTGDILDFVCNRWYKISQKEVETLIDRVFSEKKKQLPGLGYSPDPVESTLECLYLLYLHGFTNDLSPLDELCPEYPHLYFLLHPNTFNYDLVDFSDNIWVLFTSNESFVSYFIQHKEKIVPKMKDKLKKGLLSENEKKILYGIFLKSTEIWDK